ncbi:DUF5133 domain-containing protein [Streptomyces sp. NWU49]|uniref:DUF5133 domain-containing protein n=1 Tax=Streptomyces sp. NWU49 TaxID=2201153 RepID=UPI000D67D979|nr:DUF5133 domain-containing protein [Streptomyces sp. NWU49]PWJ08327.1 DUF5133 domain-containing protein [Streptomyces sp. NWU49]
MLKPHPTVLRRLVQEYEARLRSGTAPDADGPRLSDLAYTLCVSTGTRDVEDALRTAHRWLAAAPAPVPAPSAGPGALVPLPERHRRDTTAAGAPAPA